MIAVFALVASAGISSGLAAFPLVRVKALISAFEGLSQLMGSCVSGGDV